MAQRVAYSYYVIQEERILLLWLFLYFAWGGGGCGGGLGDALPFVSHLPELGHVSYQLSGKLGK